MSEPDDDIQIPATNANFSTGPATGSPTKVEPTAGQLADGVVAGVSIKAEHVNSILNNLATWIDHQRDDCNGDFGDASDGNVTITGGTTTLVRDMFYDSLIVDPTGVLITAGYRVYARSLTVEDGGVIHNNGVDGGDSVGGGAGTSGASGGFGTLGTGDAGGVGSDDAAGVAGSATVNAIGGAGGAGGTVGAFAGGAGGTATAPANSDGGFRSRHAAMGSIAGRNGAAALLTLLEGGAGGGSGAVSAPDGGSGGGGGGGGLVSIHAHTIVMDSSATISATGGDGGSPSAVGAEEVAGSGGGGGGGVMIVYRRLRFGTSLANSVAIEPADLAAEAITVEAAGGAPSSGINSGDPGIAGSAGSVLWWRI